MAVKQTSTASPTTAYARWGGTQPPEAHALLLVPQSMADGFDGFCSCGKWSAFADFGRYPTRALLVAAMTEAHEAHVAKERAE